MPSTPNQPGRRTRRPEPGRPEHRHESSRHEPRPVPGRPVGRGRPPRGVARLAASVAALALAALPVALPTGAQAAEPASTGAQAADPATGAHAADPAAGPVSAGLDLSGSGGCSAAVVSADSANTPIGVTDTDVAASPDAALPVRRGGMIAYEVHTTELMRDNVWTLHVAGTQVDSGTRANHNNVQQVSGTVSVDSYLPANVTGTMKVEVDLTAGDGTSCTAVTWVTTGDNGLTSLNGLFGLALAAAGIAGLALSLPTVRGGQPRTHGVRGALAGALLGFGAATVLVSTSVVALGSPWTALGVHAAGVALGALLGGVLGKLLPPRGGSAPTLPATPAPPPAASA